MRRDIKRASPIDERAAGREPRAVSREPPPQTGAAETLLLSVNKMCREKRETSILVTKT